MLHIHEKNEKVMIMKIKEKGNIKRTIKIMANAVQFLNGDIQKKHARVPIILLDYEPPESAHDFAKGERFALWIKLEEAQYKQTATQLKKNIRELTIWFKKEDRDKLAQFLNKPKEL